MNILVLGDSSSAGIGDGRAVYPFKLYSALAAQHRGAAVENHAVPGFTTADLARYFLTLDDRPWDYVVIYLGNNEGSRSRYKGAYRAQWRLPSWLARKPRRKPIAPIVDRPRFVFEPADRVHDVANHPDDVRRNLVTVIEHATRRGARVIVVNPVANTAFPSGVGSPRAPFLKLLDLDYSIARRLVATGAESASLIDAIAAHERHDVSDAATRYQSLAAVGGVLGAIARNNLAVLHASQGGYTEAAEELRALFEEGAADASVAATNLSRVYRRTGDAAAADAWRRAAAAADTTLYRVKDPYREVIASLATRPDVHVLDLAAVLEPDDFVDYCHPTEAGHERLAFALKEAMRAETSHAQGPAHYVCRFPNPDAFFDPNASLLDYYSMTFDVSEQDVANEAQRVASQLAVATDGELQWPHAASVLQQNALHTFQHAAGHPLFDGHMLRRFIPRYGWEVGNFPEFYVYRILRSYFSHAESAGWLDDWHGHDTIEGWNLTPDIYRDRIVAADDFELHEVDLSLDVALRAMARVKRAFSSNGRVLSDCRAERIATVMYWYTREAFRYGTQSRLSMLYDRWEVEKLVEAAAVSHIIARHHQRHDLREEAATILAALTRVARVHERYAAETVDAGYEVHAGAYTRELESAATTRALHV